MTTTCFRALHLPVYGFMEEYHLLPSSLMMGLWCSHLPCCTLPPPVCVSSLIWLSPARRCYTTSGFAHTHTHTQKKMLEKDTKKSGNSYGDQRKPSAEECSDCPFQRGQSLKIKEEVLHIHAVLLFHQTGIHKYAQFVSVWYPFLVCA